MCRERGIGRSAASEPPCSTKVQLIGYTCKVPTCHFLHEPHTKGGGSISRKRYPSAMRLNSVESDTRSKARIIHAATKGAIA